MTIKAEIIADSISPDQIRIATLQLRYPRFVHAELMTHRVFSRNASSSRAIPVERLIEDIRREPAMPSYWGRNKKGMQAHEELSPEEIELAKTQWLEAMDDAIKHAEKMNAIGCHKQNVNRILEPFSHINVLVTSTSWANFMALRDHKDPMPEIRILAKEMRTVLRNHQPTPLSYGEWHLPYITDEDRKDVFMKLRIGAGEDQLWNMLINISTARAARVSYLTHEMKPPAIDADLKLTDQLLGSTPLHASPAEHQATPDTLDKSGYTIVWKKPHLHGNFKGWIQHRKTLPYEYINDEDFVL